MVDFSKEVFPRLLEENVGLFGFQADGYWSDIGNIQQYRQAQFDLLDGKVVASLTSRKRSSYLFIRSDTNESGVRMNLVDVIF